MHRKEVRKLGRTNNEINIHKCFFESNAIHVKKAMKEILKGDSLNDGDIQAVKILADVYDNLSNPVRENEKLYPGNHKIHHSSDKS